METFLASEAAALGGISYRQLDYWVRTGLVRPSLLDARGSGYYREFSFADVVRIRMIKSLLDAGIRLDAVREVFTCLSGYTGETLASCHVVITGTKVFLCSGDQLLDVVKQAGGVINVLPVGAVVSDVSSRAGCRAPA